MKTIFIDIDDVVCTNHIVPVLAKYTNKLLKEEDFAEVLVEKVIFPNKKDRKKFDDFYVSLDSYQFSKLKPHAFDVLKRLCKKHNVFLLSSCCHYENKLAYGRQFFDKWQFILKKLPFFPPENIVFAHNKNLFFGDAIVNDRLYNLTKSKCKQKILFTAFNNKNIDEKELKKSGIKRAKNWLDLEKIIEQI